MVGTSRSSAGPGARLYGAVQRVQLGPLRAAVGARREAGARAAGGASHCERGADAGERCAAAGGCDAGGVGAVVAGCGGLGRAAAGGSAGAGGVGGDERAGAAGPFDKLRMMVHRRPTPPRFPPTRPEIFLGGCAPQTPARGGRAALARDVGVAAAVGGQRRRGSPGLRRGRLCLRRNDEQGAQGWRPFDVLGASGRAQRCRVTLTRRYRVGLSPRRGDNSRSGGGVR